jgi:hypothetical protein
VWQNTELCRRFSKMRTLSFVQKLHLSVTVLWKSPAHLSVGNPCNLSRARTGLSYISKAFKVAALATYETKHFFDLPVKWGANTSAVCAAISRGYCVGLTKSLGFDEGALPTNLWLNFTGVVSVAPLAMLTGSNIITCVHPSIS